MMLSMTAVTESLLSAEAVCPFCLQLIITAIMQMA
jgi:hypothetical protein